jgi:deoxyribose-phosphate aldolase
MRVEELAKSIDHTVLGAETTRAVIAEACAEGRQYHFATVCSFPHFVPQMVEALSNCDVKTCAAIAFPYGAELPSAKASAAEAAIAEGVDEIDVVMNVPAMLSGEFIQARDDVARLIHSVRSRSVNDGRGNVIIKVIIEAPLLDDKLVRLACKIVDDCGADYAKTCTGVGTKATVHHVELMRDALSENVGVKAAGGIRTLEDAEMMVNAGATRVGTSSAVSIILEAIARENGG